MSQLVLHPSDTSQWHALVNEAQLACSCQLTEDIESYLVFLLMRFSQEPELISSILAVDFIDAINSAGQMRQDILRDVGDKSLLFSGLFPGLADKKRVKKSYFIDMGQIAYGTLSVNVEFSQADLYSKLSHGFISLIDVLTAMRNITKDNAYSLDWLTNSANDSLSDSGLFLDVIPSSKLN